MKNLRTGLTLLTLLTAASFLAASPPQPPEVPANLEISVSPDGVAAGQEARVIVKLRPIDGVKINRYPKIKLHVPQQDGLVAEARAEVGNDKPPAPDAMAANYFKTVDPVTLTLQLDAGLAPGNHEIDGKLTYYYCVSASGFCAPKRVGIKIPVAVR